MCSAIYPITRPTAHYCCVPLFHYRPVNRYIPRIGITQRGRYRSLAAVLPTPETRIDRRLTAGLADTGFERAGGAHSQGGEK
ncbi:MAG: hypothetical protein KatS3mg056_1255 [Chloroflexus sp.]|nr:MAG: hypothetical protein KatS3mg056_1255 [Chloroflexus sp.]